MPFQDCKWGDNMADRDVSLTPRAEGTKEARPIPVPKQFSLSEIKQHFLDSMSEVKAQYAVADSLIAGDQTEAYKTIWRSQIVLAEGLLDFYIHEMSKYCLFKMFSGEWDKSEKYDSFMVPMSQVEKAIYDRESDDWFFNYLNERFSRDVFLSSDSMRDQLNLIGIVFKDTMRAAFPRDKEETSVKDGTKIVKELFKRRNEIAHQNDRSHASAEQTDITKEYVEEYISKIETIVNAIQGIAEGKG